MAKCDLLTGKRIAEKWGEGQRRNGLRRGGNRARAGMPQAHARSALCRFCGAAQCRLRKMGLAGGIFRTKMTAEGVSGAENGSQRGWKRGKRAGNYEMREKREKGGEISRKRGGIARDPMSEFRGPQRSICVNSRQRRAGCAYLQSIFGYQGAGGLENGEKWLENGNFSRNRKGWGA